MYASQKLDGKDASVGLNSAHRHHGMNFQPWYHGVVKKRVFGCKIEIRPFRNGWPVYERPGVQPVFLTQEEAI